MRRIYHWMELVIFLDKNHKTASVKSKINDYFTKKNQQLK